MKKKDRRKALKALAIGSPIVWTKPVISYAVLPAHGNTSCMTTLTCDGSIQNCPGNDCTDVIVELNRLRDDCGYTFDGDGSQYNCLPPLE